MKITQQTIQSQAQNLVNLVNIGAGRELIKQRTGELLFNSLKTSDRKMGEFAFMLASYTDKSMFGGKVFEEVGKKLRISV